MLINASVIKGYAVSAIDGPIGTVSDFLFVDTNWTLRWVVANTSSIGVSATRKVLLPATAVAGLEPDDRHLTVKLSIQQVMDSPGVDPDQPLSRLQETSLEEHYSGGSSVEPDQAVAGHWPKHEGDPNLHSIAAVTGYRIHASDGDIGHVEDYLLEETDWSIRFLVVDTRSLWQDRKVLISQRNVRLIEWTEKSVHLNVDRERVRNSPAYDPRVPVDTTFEAYFQSYYAGPTSDDPP